MPGVFGQKRFFVIGLRDGSQALALLFHRHLPLARFVHHEARFVIDLLTQRQKRRGIVERGRSNRDHWAGLHAATRSSIGTEINGASPQSTMTVLTPSGTAPKRCPECNGSGVVATSQGLFALQQPCPRCRGNGTIVETPCGTCKGSGRERRTKRYTVRIPAGPHDHPGGRCAAIEVVTPAT